MTLPLQQRTSQKQEDSEFLVELYVLCLQSVLLSQTTIMRSF